MLHLLFDSAVYLRSVSISGYATISYICRKERDYAIIQQGATPYRENF